MAPLRLQKQVGKVYKGKRYYKFVVVLPNELIEKLGWKVGQELVPTLKDRTLRLNPL